MESQLAKTTCFSSQERFDSVNKEVQNGVNLDNDLKAKSIQELEGKLKLEMLKI